MKSKKNIYLWTKAILSGKLVPTLWFSCKTYFEERGTTVDEWWWADPFIHDKTPEEILEECKTNPPNIFGFSLYIWNHLEADQLAKEIKRLYPKCLIIYGGPQVDIKYSGKFFQEKPWVDLVVPSDVYGEPVLTHILDNFDNLKYQDIPEVYYQRAGMKLRSKIGLKKRDYVWPKNIYKSQKEFFKFDPKNSMAVYETTRGCPYKCTYCDWGGGTYTKVVRKPMETVFDELTFLCSYGIESFYFADANFGIFKDDIKIIEHVVELKKKYNRPLVMSVENAKNSLERVVDIQRLLIKNNLSLYYKIAIQNPHDDIKKNIERVDIPFEDQINAIRTLRKEHPAPILIETILGLPGDNYQRTLEAIDMFHVHDVESFRPAIWNLLPEAPAYAPEERERMGIKSKWFEIYTWPFRYKNESLFEDGVRVLGHNHTMLLENVIETFSYDRYEWCDMLVLTMLGGVAKPVGFNFITEYFKQEHNLLPSIFYDKFFKDILKNKQFNSEILNDKLGNVPEKLYKLVNDPNTVKLEFDIGPDFPLWLSPHSYVTFLVMLYPQELFEALGNFFSKELNDSRIKDLCYYLANIMIDVDYNPAIGKTFTTEYNWFSYFNDGKELTQGTWEYQISDKLLKFKGTDIFEISDYPTITNKVDRIKQFFYHRGSNGARIKFANQIKETKKESSTVDFQI